MQFGLAQFVSVASLRWMVRNRAWTPYYLVRYWRFLCLKLRRPDIVTEGFVFLGRGVELRARRGHGRLILGRWVHLGDGVALRAHEGTLHIGDKCVLGGEATVNCYLDIEVGEASIIADWVYICDFDHVTSDIAIPIKDQGIVKSPVRIGPDCWIGTKVTVLRGAFLGQACVAAAHTVVRGEIPEFSVVAGVPGRVVKNRREGYADVIAVREALRSIDAKNAAAISARCHRS
jgi:acetyltransferase-like isoleucine patch superfamily enzyme